MSNLTITRRAARPAGRRPVGPMIREVCLIGRARPEAAPRPGRDDRPDRDAGAGSSGPAAADPRRYVHLALGDASTA